MNNERKQNHYNFFREIKIKKYASNIVPNWSKVAVIFLFSYSHLINSLISNSA